MTAIEIAALVWSNREYILQIIEHIIAGAAVLSAVTPADKNGGLLSRASSLVDLAALRFGGAQSTETKSRMVDDIKRLLANVIKGK